VHFRRWWWVEGPRRRQGTIPTVSTSSGTDGSNPAPSSGESGASLVFNAFRRGLADLGYIDGQNIRIEYRLAAGDNSRSSLL
jgi:hypothetical protein